MMGPEPGQTDFRASSHSLSNGLMVAAVLARRELVRFARQPARIAAAIGTPLLLWAFMSSGFARSFRPAALGDASYASFLLPGAMTLVAVFAAIFSSISVIEDRQQGWLQSVLVAPVPRWSIALGRILGGAAVAFAQAAVLLFIAPVIGVQLTASGAAMALAALATTSFAMTALGLAFAWHSRSTAAFHAVMNLVFMPMWLLSGAFFPPPSGDGAWSAAWLGWLMRINPLTWCTAAIRDPMIHDAAGATTLSLAAAAAFALIMMVLATAIIARPRPS